MVKASWSGCYPVLCQGEWHLEVDGKNVSHLIPEEIRNDPMYTYKEYASWHFENWDEIFEYYECGLREDEWIEKNKSWLDKITTDLNVQKEIFTEINKYDWQYNSCGGCI